MRSGNNRIIKRTYCSIQGCKNPVWSSGFCKIHTKRRPKEHKDIPSDKGTWEMHNFFEELWGQLPKIKKCWSCGKRIYGENLSIYWDHLLPKEIYPELKYNKENMFFCCSECHDLKTRGFPTKKHQEAIERAEMELLNEK